MSTTKATALALAALTMTGASGAVTTAEAGGFKKHGHLIIKPVPFKRYYWAPYPAYVGIAPRYVCHWSPKMRAYGYWRFGMFVPCWW